MDFLKDVARIFFKIITAILGGILVISPVIGFAYLAATKNFWWVVADLFYIILGLSIVVAIEERKCPYLY